MGVHTMARPSLVTPRAPEGEQVAPSVTPWTGLEVVVRPDAAVVVV
jgi:hypothetical protein